MRRFGEPHWRLIAAPAAASPGQARATLILEGELNGGNNHRGGLHLLNQVSGWDTTRLGHVCPW
mgnify:CR=1 FL=1